MWIRTRSALILGSLTLSACTLIVSTNGLTSDPVVTSDAGSDGALADGRSDATVDVEASGPRTYRDEVLADGPIFYLQLDEANGVVAKNEVAGGPTGSFQGTVSFKAAGALASGAGTAVTLNGGSIDMGTGFDFASQATFTLEAWVKPTTIDTSYRSIFGHLKYDASGRQGYALWIHTDALGFERNRDYSSTPADYCGTDDGIPRGVFSHLVATYDGDSMHLFVNAKEVATRKSSLSIRANNLPLVLGGGDDLSAFEGSLDEIAVYGRALSTARVVAHYEAAKR